MARNTCWTIDPPHQYPPLPRGAAPADVVVIGGGLVGTAVAYWLARQHSRVVLLEAGQLASGSTGRNAGLMLHNVSDIEHPQLLQDVEEQERLRLEYCVPGHLSLASRPEVWEAFRAEVQRRPAWAPPLHALDRPACEDLLRLRIDDRYFGGRWCPGGAVIHPVRFAYELAHAATTHGARLHTATTVMGVDRPAHGLLVRTNRGSIATTAVVHATAASCRLLPELATALRRLRVQMMATERLSPIFSIGLGVNWGDVFGRQLSDGTVVLGGAGSTPVASDDCRDEIDDDAQSRLRAFLPRSFPGVPALSAVRQTWSGVLDCTEDGKPLVGPHPGREGQWLCTGFNGHGLPGALGIARSIASALLSGASSSPLTLWTPDRFAVLRNVNEEPTSTCKRSIADATPNDVRSALSRSRH